MKEDLVLNKEGNPLRVLEIGSHCCIRLIKQARALRKKGYIVDIFAGKLSYGVYDFDRIYYWNSGDSEIGHRQLKAMLPELKDKYDIFHYHNEPDYPVTLMHEAGLYPIIADCHDLDSVRLNIVTQDEVNLFKYSDGIVHVSQPVCDYATTLHNYEKPYTVLTHYCNEGVIDYTPEQDKLRHGVVYEGGANGSTDEMGESFRYRSLYPIAKKIVEMGNELTMYIGNADGVTPYSEIGAVAYPPTIYDDMMKGLTNHKWGLVTFNNPDKTQRQTNLTLTNKMFEYISAGVVPIFYGCEESARFAREELGVGIEVNKIEELGCIDDTFGNNYPELKEKVDKVRRELTMENHIYKLEELYKKVLEN